MPELRNLPNHWIHRPWEAPEELLRSAGITLGVTYPYPIVDLVETRDRALQALEAMKRSVGADHDGQGDA